MKWVCKQIYENITSAIVKIWYSKKNYPKIQQQKMNINWTTFPKY